MDSLREERWENRRYAEEFITKEIKGIHAVRGEATYLLWLDCREVTDDATRFCAFIRQHSGLYVCDGNEYKNGQSFLRVNLACPKETEQTDETEANSNNPISLKKSRDLELTVISGIYIPGNYCKHQVFFIQKNVNH